MFHCNLDCCAIVCLFHLFLQGKSKVQLSPTVSIPPSHQNWPLFCRLHSIDLLTQRHVYKATEKLPSLNSALKYLCSLSGWHRVW